MEAALERVKHWTLADVLPKLKQPFLIVHEEEDKAIPIEDAHKTFAAAGSLDKELRIFTRDESGAEHVSADAPSAGIQTICDWFAKKL
jgi:esterase/lipase